MRRLRGKIAAIVLIWCCTVAVPVAHAQAPQQERRVALVIGNTAYTHIGRLANPGNDAKLIADTLRGLGFSLVGNGVQRDLDKAHFDQAIRQFGQQIQGAEVALFYYAGHGMQIDGTNWLLPVDSNPTQSRDADFQMVDASLVLKQMDGAGTRLNIVLLDACRNNPFSTLGTRSIAGGLAQMRAPEGTLISFATQPGNVAADGSGADGPYATALAAAMRQPGVDIFKTFNQVGLDVKRATGSAQLPWVSSSPIDGDFYFVRGGETPPEMTVAALTSPPPSIATGATRDSSTPATAEPETELRARAQQGQPDAETNLALLLSAPTAANKNFPEAIRLLEQAASHGYPRAQFQLGVFNERGYGMERNYAAALEWYRKAAEQDHIGAELTMARFYLNGLGVARDLEERKKWLLRAAGQGSALAQYLVGNMNYHGVGMTRDLPAAAEWYQKSANRDFPPAQAQLALMYEQGTGVTQDYGQALRLARQAAAKNNAQSQNILGRLYERGLGVEKSPADAVRWYKLSAEQGFTAAEFNLGRHYATGVGVKRDPEAAKQWFAKAAAGGNEAAAARLAKMEGGKDQATAQRR